MTFTDLPLIFTFTREGSLYFLAYLYTTENPWSAEPVQRFPAASVKRTLTRKSGTVKGKSGSYCEMILPSSK